MQINLWAVLVSGIASMVIGSIWYGPLFGKKFMHEMGMDGWSEEKKNKMRKSMVKSYVGQFVASVVSFYFLAWLMIATGMMSVMGGMSLAFVLWLGFVVPLKLGEALWGGKMSLFWMGVGANLVTLLVVGAIIGGWQ